MFYLSLTAKSGSQEFDQFCKVFESVIKAYFEQNSLLLDDILSLNDKFGNPLGMQEKIPEQLDFITLILLPSEITFLIQTDWAYNWKFIKIFTQGHFLSSALKGMKLPI